MNGLDLTDIENIPIRFMIVPITMIVMATFLFWFFKQKQWIMSNDDHDDDDKIKQQNKLQDSDSR
jgi:hypothetical protein